jgi:hypothetical protein
VHALGWSSSTGRGGPTGAWHPKAAACGGGGAPLAVDPLMAPLCAIFLLMFSWTFSFGRCEKETGKEIGTEDNWLQFVVLHLSLRSFPEQI